MKRDRKEYFRAWRARNKEKMLDHYRTYAKEHRDELAQYHKNWRTNNPNRVRSYFAKFRKTHASYYKILRATQSAQERGLLIAPATCQRCSAIGPLQKHHPDYSKPLEIIWLCYPCHLAEHGKKVRTWKPKQLTP